MALLLEEAQRLMAERDPATLLRHVCTAAQPLTHASFVGVGIVDGDGAVNEFVAVGLDEGSSTSCGKRWLPIAITLHAPPSSRARSFAA